jgi:hypothetical protein
VLYTIESFVPYAQANTGKCFPSVPTIAAGAGVDERTARRAIHTLEEKQWLKVETNSEAGWNQSHTYRITPPEGQASMPQVGAQDPH